MAWRKFLMRAAWHVKNIGDDMYRMGYGGEEHIFGPQYCNHCGKWNFEPVTVKETSE
jgi:hypothetical protein